MSKENRINRTHHGRLFGVPVYLDMTDPECPAIEPKYKLDLVLDLAEYLFFLYCVVRTGVDSSFIPMYPILVGEEVEV